MEAEDFLTPREESQVVEAIKQAEKNTSGEIRVHINEEIHLNQYEHAQEIFEELNMVETKDRNGVLFYLAVNEKGFSILGDIGIDAVVPDDFWEDTRDLVLSHLAKGERVAALVNGILKAGEALKKYFPYQSNDTNELPNAISKN